MDDEPRDPDFTIPDVIEPVVGYRMWHVDLTDSRGEAPLFSVYNHTAWPVDGVEATHAPTIQRSIHRASPHKGCSCGIYAHKNIAQVLAQQVPMYVWQLRGTPRLSTRTLPIVRHTEMGDAVVVEPYHLDELDWDWTLTPKILLGRVLMGGRFFPYTKGYRAQYAKIDELYYIPPTTYNTDMPNETLLRTASTLNQKQIIESGFKVLNDIGNYYGVKVKHIDQIIKEQGYEG